MKTSSQQLLHLRAHINASQELNSWIAGARALALLNGAQASGALHALRAAVTPEQIAAAADLDEQSAADLCLALLDHGIVRQNGGTFQLSPDYALLQSASAPVPLEKLLRQSAVINQALHQIPRTGPAYTTLPDEDVLAMAEAAGISALSAAPHISPVMIAQALPEVEARWQAGARHLEVGCGVGNALFGIVMAYPRVTAVGIEINKLTHQEAQRRAALLDIAGRVQLRCMDACDLQEREQYDTIQWSQFFFPGAIRPTALRAMRRALKPGGCLLMPWLGSVSSDTMPSRAEMLKTSLRMIRTGGLSFMPYLLDALGDTAKRRRKEQRFAAIQRLLFRRWGVPVRTLSELRSELQGHGFTIVRTPRMPATQFALTRGFILARREAG